MDHFNWVQRVVEDTDPNRPTVNGVQPPVPYLDPPIGGWDGEPDDLLPGYYSETDDFSPSIGDQSITTVDTLNFFDGPDVSVGSVVRFQTTLAGVDGESFTLLGETFEWQATGMRLDDGTERTFVELLRTFPLSGFSPSDIDFYRSHGIAILVPEPAAFAQTAMVFATALFIAIRRRTKTRS